MLVLASLGHAHDSRFATLHLPLGVTVEVPKNWWLLGGDYNATIETAGEAALNLTGFQMPTGKKVNLFRANSMPRSTYAAIAINASDSELSAEGLAAASDAELAKITTTLKDGMQRILAQQDLKLLDFEPVRIVMLDGHYALSVSYRRSGPQGPVSAKQTRLLVGKKEISLNLSYRESEAALWKPIVGYITKSFAVNKSKTLLAGDAPPLRTNNDLVHYQ